MSKANFSTRWFMCIADHPGITTPCQIAVLMSMKTFMDNDTGECYPTEEQLAKRARCNRRTVTSVISKAQELGLLIVEKRKSKSGVGYRHNHYHPQIPGEKNIFLLNNKTKPEEMKTKPEEMKAKTVRNEEQNNEKSFPTNYSNNYSNNYSSNYYVKDTSVKKKKTPEEIQKFREDLSNAFKIK